MAANGSMDMRRGSVIAMVCLFIIGGGVCAIALVRHRDSAASILCQNRLRLIGLGFHNHAGTYGGRLPGIHARVTNKKRPDEKFDEQISWLYAILPYHGGADSRYGLDPMKPLDAFENRWVVNASVPDYLCPANPFHGLNGQENFTNYVGITGVGRDAAFLPLTDPRCGFIGVPRRRINKDITDGTSATLAVVETATNNGPWALAGDGTLRGLDVEGTDYLGEHGQFNSLHARDYPFSRPSITNACFADASVRGLSANLSPSVFEALATIAGGEQLPPDW